MIAMRQGSVTDFALLILLAFGIAFAVVMALAIIVGCGTVAKPSPQTLSCEAQYGACVNPDVEAYRACRTKVDSTCLAADGGTHD